MYKVQWDSNTRGVALQSATENEGKSDIRPVFFEELDLLGFADLWSYPRTSAPLLWSDKGHNYYYQGEKVAKARAAGYFHRPEIVEAQKNLSLIPVDVAGMSARNLSQMEALAQEAVSFIRKTARLYRNKVDAVVASFSGGKDSLVLLDLMRRGLSPDDFFAIFNDTDMELDVTHKAVDAARKHWSDVTIHTARSHFRAEDSWRLFGPPSRLHRWCCSVHKSVPTQLYLRELLNKPGVRILLFDGVRSEESASRALYARVTKGGKNSNQINASPILGWNEAEVYLYLLAHNLFFNEAYRYGMSRVGCALCPLASKWWDSILFSNFSKEASPFAENLLSYAEKIGKASEHAKKEYITERAWCGRAGGRHINCQPFIFNQIDSSTYTFYAPDDKNIIKWFSTLGSTKIISENHFKIEHRNYSFLVKKQEDTQNYSISIQFSLDKFLFRDLKNVVAKAIYCVACGACDAICPMNALDTMKNKIDFNACIHCKKCTTITEKGCFAAKSLWISIGGEGVKGINRYNHFGIRIDWLSTFFAHLAAWPEHHGIGSLQFTAMKTWLKEAEFFDGKQVTDTALLLSKLSITHPFIWEVLWANLAQNSALIRWYITEIEWGEQLSKSDLVLRAGDSLSESSRSNAMLSLLSLLENTPLGELGLGEVTGAKARRVVHKKGLPRFTQPETLLYLLAKKATETQIFNFTLAQIQEDDAWGPQRLFGVPLHECKATLTQLADLHPALVRVEFVKNLDNIFLEKAATPLEVVRCVAG